MAQKLSILLLFTVVFFLAKIEAATKSIFKPHTIHKVDGLNSQEISNFLSKEQIDLLWLLEGQQWKFASSNPSLANALLNLGFLRLDHLRNGATAFIRQKIQAKASPIPPNLTKHFSQSGYHLYEYPDTVSRDIENFFSRSSFLLGQPEDILEVFSQDNQGRWLFYSPGSHKNQKIYPLLDDLEPGMTLFVHFRAPVIHSPQLSAQDLPALKGSTSLTIRNKSEDAQVERPRISFSIQKIQTETTSACDEESSIGKASAYSMEGQLLARGDVYCNAQNEVNFQINPLTDLDELESYILDVKLSNGAQQRAVLHPGSENYKLYTDEISTLHSKLIQDKCELAARTTGKTCLLTSLDEEMVVPQPADYLSFQDLNGVIPVQDLENFLRENSSTPQVQSLVQVIKDWNDPDLNPELTKGQSLFFDHQIQNYDYISKAREFLESEYALQKLEPESSNILSDCASAILRTELSTDNKILDSCNLLSTRADLIQKTQGDFLAQNYLLQSFEEVGEMFRISILAETLPGQNQSQAIDLANRLLVLPERIRSRLESNSEARQILVQELGQIQSLVRNMDEIQKRLDLELAFKAQLELKIRNLEDYKKDLEQSLLVALNPEDRYKEIAHYLIGGGEPLELAEILENKPLAPVEAGPLVEEVLGQTVNSSNLLSALILNWPDPLFVLKLLQRTAPHFTEFKFQELLNELDHPEFSREVFANAGSPQAFYFEELPLILNLDASRSFHRHGKKLQFQWSIIDSKNGALLENLGSLTSSPVQTLKLEIASFHDSELTLEVLAFDPATGESSRDQIKIDYLGKRLPKISLPKHLAIVENEVQRIPYQVLHYPGTEVSIVARSNEGIEVLQTTSKHFLIKGKKPGFFSLQIELNHEQTKRSNLMKFQVEVTPNLGPVADLGPDQVVLAKTPWKLPNYSFSPVGERLEYRWLPDPSINSTFSRNPVFLTTKAGSYPLSVRVIDESGRESLDSIKLEVLSSPAPFASVPDPVKRSFYYLKWNEFPVNACSSFSYQGEELQFEWSTPRSDLEGIRWEISEPGNCKTMIRGFMEDYIHHKMGESMIPDLTLHFDVKVSDSKGVSKARQVYRLFPGGFHPRIEVIPHDYILIPGEERFVTARLTRAFEGGEVSFKWRALSRDASDLWTQSPSGWHGNKADSFTVKIPGDYRKNQYLYYQLTSSEILPDRSPIPFTTEVRLEVQSYCTEPPELTLEPLFDLPLRAGLDSRELLVKVSSRNSCPRLPADFVHNFESDNPALQVIKFSEGLLTLEFDSSLMAIDQDLLKLSGNLLEKRSNLADNKDLEIPVIPVQACSLTIIPNPGDSQNFEIPQGVLVDFHSNLRCPGLVDVPVEQLETQWSYVQSGWNHEVEQNWIWNGEEASSKSSVFTTIPGAVQIKVKVVDPAKRVYVDQTVPLEVLYPLKASVFAHAVSDADGIRLGNGTFRSEQNEARILLSSETSTPYVANKNVKGRWLLQSGSNGVTLKETSDEGSYLDLSDIAFEDVKNANLVWRGFREDSPQYPLQLDIDTQLSFSGQEEVTGVELFDDLLYGKIRIRVHAKDPHNSISSVELEFEDESGWKKSSSRYHYPFIIWDTRADLGDVSKEVKIRLTPWTYRQTSSIPFEGQLTVRNDLYPVEFDESSMNCEGSDPYKCSELNAQFEISFTKDFHPLARYDDFSLEGLVSGHWLNPFQSEPLLQVETTISREQIAPSIEMSLKAGFEPFYGRGVRKHFVAIVDGDSIELLGGTNSRGEFLSNQRLTLTTNGSFKEEPSRFPEIQAKGIQKRLVSTPAGEIAWQLRGGKNEFGQEFRTRSYKKDSSGLFVLFDLSAQAAETSKINHPQTPDQREAITLAQSDSLLVLGGQDASSSVTDTIRRYVSGAGGQWLLDPYYAVDSLSYPRIHGAAVRIGNQLFVIGGQSSELAPLIESYLVNGNHLERSWDRKLIQQKWEPSIEWEERLWEIINLSNHSTKAFIPLSFELQNGVSPSLGMELHYQLKDSIRWVKSEALSHKSMSLDSLDTNLDQYTVVWESTKDLPDYYGKLLLKLVSSEGEESEPLEILLENGPAPKAPQIENLTIAPLSQKVYKINWDLIQDYNRLSNLQIFAVVQEEEVEIENFQATPPRYGMEFIWDSKDIEAYDKAAKILVRAQDVESELESEANVEFELRNSRIELSIEEINSACEGELSKSGDQTKYTLKNCSSPMESLQVHTEIKFQNPGEAISSSFDSTSSLELDSSLSNKLLIVWKQDTPVDSSNATQKIPVIWTVAGSDQISQIQHELLLEWERVAPQTHLTLESFHCGSNLISKNLAVAEEALFLDCEGQEKTIILDSGSSRNFYPGGLVRNWSLPAKVAYEKLDSQGERIRIIIPANIDSEELSGELRVADAPNQILESTQDFQIRWKNPIRVQSTMELISSFYNKVTGQYEAKLRIVHNEDETFQMDEIKVLHPLKNESLTRDRFFANHTREGGQTLVELNFSLNDAFPFCLDEPEIQFFARSELGQEASTIDELKKISACESLAELGLNISNETLEEAVCDQQTHSMDLVTNEGDLLYSSNPDCMKSDVSTRFTLSLPPEIERFFKEDLFYPQLCVNLAEGDFYCSSVHKLSKNISGHDRLKPLEFNWEANEGTTVRSVLFHQAPGLRNAQWIEDSEELEPEEKEILFNALELENPKLELKGHLRLFTQTLKELHEQNKPVGRVINFFSAKSDLLLGAQESREYLRVIEAMVELSRFLGEASSSKERELGEFLLGLTIQYPDFDYCEDQNYFLSMAQLLNDGQELLLFSRPESKKQAEGIFDGIIEVFQDGSTNSQDQKCSDKYMEALSELDQAGEDFVEELQNEENALEALSSMLAKARVQLESQRDNLFERLVDTTAYNVELSYYLLALEQATKTLEDLVRKTHDSDLLNKILGQTLRESAQNSNDSLKDLQLVHALSNLANPALPVDYTAVLKEAMGEKSSQALEFLEPLVLQLDHDQRIELIENLKGKLERKDLLYLLEESKTPLHKMFVNTGEDRRFEIHNEETKLLLNASKMIDPQDPDMENNYSYEWTITEPWNQLEPLRIVTQEPVYNWSVFTTKVSTQESIQDLFLTEGATTRLVHVMVTNLDTGSSASDSHLIHFYQTLPFEIQAKYNEKLLIQESGSMDVSASREGYNSRDSKWSFQFENLTPEIIQLHEPATSRVKYRTIQAGVAQIKVQAKVERTGGNSVFRTRVFDILVQQKEKMRLNPGPEVRVVTPQQVTLHNYSTDGLEFYWNGPACLDNPTKREPLFQCKEVGVYTYKMEGWDEAGNHETRITRVHVLPKPSLKAAFHIPSAFQITQDKEQLQLDASPSLLTDSETTVQWRVYSQDREFPVINSNSINASLEVLDEDFPVDEKLHIELTLQSAQESSTLTRILGVRRNSNSPLIIVNSGHRGGVVSFCQSPYFDFADSYSINGGYLEFSAEVLVGSKGNRITPLGSRLDFRRNDRFILNFDRSKWRKQNVKVQFSAIQENDGKRVESHHEVDFLVLPSRCDFNSPEGGTFPDLGLPEDMPAIELDPDQKEFCLPVDNPEDPFELRFEFDRNALTNKEGSACFEFDSETPSRDTTVVLQIIDEENQVIVEHEIPVVIIEEEEQNQEDPQEEEEEENQENEDNSPEDELEEEEEVPSCTQPQVRDLAVQSCPSGFLLEFSSKLTPENDNNYEFAIHAPNLPSIRVQTSNLIPRSSTDDNWQQFQTCVQHPASWSGLRDQVNFEIAVSEQQCGLTSSTALTETIEFNRPPEILHAEFLNNKDIIHLAVKGRDLDLDDLSWSLEYLSPLSGTWDPVEKLEVQDLRDDNEPHSFQLDWFSKLDLSNDYKNIEVKINLSDGRSSVSTILNLDWLQNRKRHFTDVREINTGATPANALASCQNADDGQLYFSGGWTGPSSVSNELHRFNPATMSIEAMNNMQLHRAEHACIIYENRIWLLGGRNVKKQNLKTEIIDLDTQESEKVNDQNINRASAVWLQDDNMVYIFGGYTNSGHGVNTYETLNLDNGKARRLGQSRFKNFFATGQLYNGSAYMFGGMHEDSDRLKTAMRYSIETDEWVQLANLPETRIGAASFVRDGKIYIIGGRDEQGQHAQSILIYDPSTDSYSTKGNLTLPRYQATVATHGSDILLLGGVNRWDQWGEPEYILPKDGF